jgi:hypothetical protein
MEYKRLTAEYCGVFCKIEEDNPGIGAHLYVFLPDGTSYDELQDSLAICQENALEEYGIPLNYWQAAPSIFR